MSDTQKDANAASPLPSIEQSDLAAAWRFLTGDTAEPSRPARPFHRAGGGHAPTLRNGITRARNRSAVK